MKAYIDIVFDGPPAHESGRFVEVEDANQCSISIGEWIEDGDLWRLRIPDPRRCAELEAECNQRSSETSRIAARCDRMGEERDAARRQVTDLKAERDGLKADLGDEIRRLELLAIGYRTERDGLRLELADAREMAKQFAHASATIARIRLEFGNDLVDRESFFEQYKELHEQFYMERDMHAGCCRELDARTKRYCAAHGSLPMEAECPGCRHAAEVEQAVRFGFTFGHNLENSEYNKAKAVDRWRAERRTP